MAGEVISEAIAYVGTSSFILPNDVHRILLFIIEVYYVLSVEYPRQSDVLCTFLEASICQYDQKCCGWKPNKHFMQYVQNIM
jgi:hypothetical protein